MALEYANIGLADAGDGDALNVMIAKFNRNFAQIGASTGLLDPSALLDYIGLGTTGSLTLGGVPATFEPSGEATQTPGLQRLGDTYANSSVGVTRYGANALSPALYFGKSRGATGAHAAVQNNDVVGRISGFGSTGTKFIEATRIEFQTTGTIGASAMQGRVVVRLNEGAAAVATKLVIDSTSVRPSTSGGMTLGGASNLWGTVYSTTGAINTSDRSEKDVIGAVDDGVLRAWARVSARAFRWRDAVAAKGDEARVHFGYIAQEVEEAFASEGLDARRYGLFCEDEVFEETELKDGDGEVIDVVRTARGKRLALRYDQCLVLEAAYQRSVTATLLDRLEAL